MSTPRAVIDPWCPRDGVERVLNAALRFRYTYRHRSENALAPVCVAASYPFMLEIQDRAWVCRFLPGYVRAWSNYALKWMVFWAQRATFSFDQMAAYERLFCGPLPEFAAIYDRDDAFCYRRIAGPNPLAIHRVTSLRALLAKIPIQPPLLKKALGRSVDLSRAVRNGRLFMADFVRLQKALRPVAVELPSGKLSRSSLTRDSRWRRKYLPAPIGVFLEEPDEHGRMHLIPLAIRIDQPQPRGEHNPVYYPDGSAAWQLAKLYFEVADQNAHFGCGHVYRTHFLMEPFCLATARQLDFDHPVHLLLQPHTRYTLATNSSAYKDFTDRKQIYFEFYAGTLEESRQIFIDSHAEKPFMDLELEAELASRGVSRHLQDYPYRDDARLWGKPIHDFVNGYIRAFYARDSIVRDDEQLQRWAGELMSPTEGALRGLVPGDRLDTIGKLVDLLAHVIFIAGPGHASQHYSEMYYCRYSPAFPAAAYAPPPWKEERANDARLRNTVPPIEPASKQFAYSDFGDFHFDTFGDYSRYPLNRVRQAAAPIRKLHDDLKQIEHTIQQRLGPRLLPYGFLLPSRVPNSINI
jgi:arachidonate 15-lipoxygenase